MTKLIKSTRFIIAKGSKVLGRNRYGITHFKIMHIYLENDRDNVYFYETEKEAEAKLFGLKKIKIHENLKIKKVIVSMELI